MKLWNMEVNTCNPSTEEAEVGGLWVQGQPVLHSKTLPQNTSKQTNKKYEVVTKVQQIVTIFYSSKPDYAWGTLKQQNQDTVQFSKAGLYPWSLHSLPACSLLPVHPLHMPSAAQLPLLPGQGFSVWDGPPHPSLSPMAGRLRFA
jgi:hypothetical protein